MRENIVTLVEELAVVELLTVASKAASSIALSVAVLDGIEEPDARIREAASAARDTSTFIAEITHLLKGA